MCSRDRIAGAVFVLVVVIVQTRWMGRAATLLSVGLVVAYLFWIAARWKNDPVAVLPMYLLSITIPVSYTHLTLPTTERV